MAENAWAASSTEKPASRRHPRTASWWRSVAGPGEVRESMTPTAHRWRNRTSRTDSARRPRVAQQALADGQRPPPHSRLPAVLAGGQLELAEDHVNHAVEQVLLVGDVVVQRHRPAPELLSNPAHAQRLQATGVGEVERGANHAPPAQGEPGLAPDVGLLDHLSLPPVPDLATYMASMTLLTDVHSTSNVRRTPIRTAYVASTEACLLLEPQTSRPRGQR